MFFAYCLRNLLARRASTASAALGIAIVVFILAAGQMLTSGITKTLRGRSGPDNRVIVLRRGAQVEFASAMTDAEVQVAKSTGALAGVPVSKELVSVVLLPGRSGKSVNVEVRGVEAEAFEVRPEVKLVTGRRPRPGTSEIMLGRALAEQLAQGAVGAKLELKSGRPASVVGIFASEGSATESELWGDFDVLRADFGRSGVASSLRANLPSGASVDALREQMASDPRLGVQVTRERDFNEQVAAGSTKLIGALAMLIAVFAALAAVLGAVIALNGSVAQRRTEIGTLRAIGFSSERILLCFFTEALLVAVAGGMLGLLAAVGLGFSRIATTNWSSFAMTVVSFDPDAKVLLRSLLVAVILGVFGGMIPALTAARVNPALTLRRL